MPGIANRASALFQALRILGTKPQAPRTNCPEAHRDAALEHYFLNISIAQAVPEIEPHTTANNFNRVTMVVIATGKIHGNFASQVAQLDNAISPVAHSLRRQIQRAQVKKVADRRQGTSQGVEGFPLQ
jgi:ribosome-associated translation inhibitor RaiA